MWKLNKFFWGLLFASLVLWITSCWTDGSDAKSSVLTNNSNNNTSVEIKYLAWIEDTQGRDIFNIPSNSYVLGGEWITLPTPEKISSYTFKGWSKYDSRNRTVSYSWWQIFNEQLTPEPGKNTAYVKLYAVWVPNIIFRLWNWNSDIVQEVGEWGKVKLNKNTFAIEWYTFKRWYNNVNAGKSYNDEEIVDRRFWESGNIDFRILKPEFTKYVTLSFYCKNSDGTFSEKVSFRQGKTIYPDQP